MTHTHAHAQHTQGCMGETQNLVTDGEGEERTEEEEKEEGQVEEKW